MCAATPVTLQLPPALLYFLYLALSSPSCSKVLCPHHSSICFQNSWFLFTSAKQTVPAMGTTSTYASSRTTTSSHSDCDEHNVWNNVLGLCFRFHVCPLLGDLLAKENWEELHCRAASPSRFSATTVFLSTLLLLRVLTAAIRQPSEDCLKHY